MLVLSHNRARPCHPPCFLTCVCCGPRALFVQSHNRARPYHPPCFAPCASPVSAQGRVCCLPSQVWRNDLGSPGGTINHVGEGGSIPGMSDEPNAVVVASSCTLVALHTPPSSPPTSDTCRKALSCLCVRFCRNGLRFCRSFGFCRNGKRFRRLHEPCPTCMPQCETRQKCSRQGPSRGVESLVAGPGPLPVSAQGRVCDLPWWISRPNRASWNWCLRRARRSFLVSAFGGRHKTSLGSTRKRSLTQGLMSSGVACSRRTCAQTCCHIPTYALGRCLSVTNGFAARCQMHFHVARSSSVGWLCSGVSPPGGEKVSGGPAVVGRESGGLGPFFLCLRAGPVEVGAFRSAGVGWKWPSEGESSWPASQQVGLKLSCARLSRSRSHSLPPPPPAWLVGIKRLSR